MRNNPDKALDAAKSLLEQADNEWKRAIYGWIMHDYVSSIRSLQLVVELNFKALCCAVLFSDNYKDLGHDICRVVDEAGKTAHKIYEKKGEDVLNEDFQRVTASLLDNDPELKKCVDETPDLQDILNGDFNSLLSKYKKHVWVDNDKNRPTEEIKKLFTDKPTDENLETYINDLNNNLKQLNRIKQKKLHIDTDNEIISFINFSNIGMPEHTKRLEIGTIRSKKAVSDFRKNYLSNQNGEKLFYYYYNYVFYPPALMLTLTTESVIIQGHQQSARYPDPEHPKTTIPKNVYTRQNPVVNKMPEVLKYSKFTLRHTKRFLKITEIIVNTQKIQCKKTKQANSKRTQNRDILNKC